MIAQHVHQVTRLPEILAADTKMPVSLASSGVLLQSSRIYVCPSAHHVVVNPDLTLTISGRERLRFFRPSGDWLLESAAAVFGERTFAVVLSGLRNDGAYGVRVVRKAGGTVIAQEPRWCERPEMPTAAIATGCVDGVLDPVRIGGYLNAQLARLDLPALQALQDDPFGYTEGTPAAG